jgi:hypothetical protein
VRFALSSATAWHDIDINFSHSKFYSAIVDYFEVTLGPVAQGCMDDLLGWWNKLVIMMFTSWANCVIFTVGKFSVAH